MPAVAYTEMIERAKQIADMGDGFPNTATWLFFLNSELKKLWVRLMRSGYPPSVTFESITADGSAQYDIDEPAAVMAVYGVTSSGKYYNVPLKQQWEQLESPLANTSTYPHAAFIVPNHTTVGEIGIILTPAPTSGTFFVVCISKPKKIVSGTPGTDESNSVYLPFGWEERIVLGMARQALTKEETVNPALEVLIRECDEQIDFHVNGYLVGQSNKVANVNDYPQTPYTDWVYI